MKAEQIAEEIISQRKGEEDNHALHLAVGRADAEVAGVTQRINSYSLNKWTFVSGNLKPPQLCAIE